MTLDAPHPWREVFELMWEAWQAGSVPVGAVVVDPAGVVVARGRNRSAEVDGPPGQLANTFIAHAEVNAIAGLPRGDYMDHALYTSLAPCGLCQMAARHGHIGTVHFAADDVLWSGLDRLPELSPHLARRWHARVGPLDGPHGEFAFLIAVLHGLSGWTSSRVHDDYRVAHPALMALADRLVADGRADDLRRMTLDDAWDALLPELGLGWA